MLNNQLHHQNQSLEAYKQSSLFYSRLWGETSDSLENLQKEILEFKDTMEIE